MIKTIFLILILAFSAFSQSITAPSITADANSKVRVSIEGEGTGIVSWQFVLYYDDTVLQPTGNLESSWGCSSGEWGSQLTCNGGEAGIYRAMGVNIYGYTGGGSLINIPFNTNKGDTDLDLEDVYFFTGNGPVPVDVGDGDVTLQ